MSNSETPGTCRAAESMSRGTARSIISTAVRGARHHLGELVGLDQQVRRRGRRDDDVGALERLG